MENENKSPQQQLEETLMYRGFGKALNKEAQPHIAAGETEFQLVHSARIVNDDISYQIYIRWSEEQKKFYLNKFDALLKPADKPGQQFLHTFYDREGITAKEAYNMLKYGEQTAVYKSMFNKKGEKYNAWMNLNTTAEKDRYNNYPLNRYTDNYYKKHPFVLADALQQLPVPVKEIEDGKHIDSKIRSLQRGNAEKVTIRCNGEEQPGILLVNAEAGKIDVYDARMQLIENKVEPAQQQKEQATEAATDDLKKKSGQEQVSWAKRDNRQGMRP